MSHHHCDEMSQRSQVSRVALCMSKVKKSTASDWLTELLTRSPIELFWTAKNICRQVEAKSHPIKFLAYLKSPRQSMHAVENLCCLHSPSWTFWFYLATEEVKLNWKSNLLFPLADLCVLMLSLVWASFNGAAFPATKIVQPLLIAPM